MPSGTFLTNGAGHEPDRESVPGFPFGSRSLGPEPGREEREKKVIGGGIAECPVYRAVLAVKGRGRGRPRP